MNLDYAVCPHCSCQCEEDDYCPGCGRLFDEDIVPTRRVSVMGLLGNGLRSLATKSEPPNIPEDIGEEATITPLLGSSWHLHYSDD